MGRRRWIVAGPDFSSTSARALAHASELASEIGASVACVHAYEDPPGTRLDSDPTPVVLSRLEEAASVVRARFPTLQVECLVRRGAPWDKLVNVACELGAEFIVVGASGEQSQPYPSFLGHVATRVASTSSRAVLVVPARADRRTDLD
jgi:nucleotide-binding universal stress UspA family protein